MYQVTYEVTIDFDEEPEDGDPTPREIETAVTAGLERKFRGFVVEAERQ